MRESGKVRVVVRSRRVPVRTSIVQIPVYSQYGTRLGTIRKRVVDYETVLDGPNRRAIDEGKKLSCDLGLEFEVVDKANAGLLRRVALAVSGRTARQPSLTVTAQSVLHVTKDQSAVTQMPNAR